MQNTRNATGRNAGAVKYDILTTLGCWALGQSKHDQRLTLRFICLITARYNWQRDLLAVGQREIASLWSCNERTVKREMARLRALGWITLKVQGHRGRVAQYGLNVPGILDSTRSAWDRIGPDFALRVDSAETTNVVPLVPNAAVPAPDTSSNDVWALAAALLHKEDPATYGAWVGALTRQERAGGRLVLKAPSRFHAAYVETHLKARLVAACQTVDADITDIAMAY